MYRNIGQIPILDLTNPQYPIYNDGRIDGRIKSLAGGSCHSIVVKNIITLVDSSIVTCTGPTQASCNVTINPDGTIPTACPAGITPGDYINMVATFNVAYPQTGVLVTFKYIENDVPIAASVIMDMAIGINVVYAFGTNVQLPSGTALALYGAEVIT